MFFQNRVNALKSGKLYLPLHLKFSHFFAVIIFILLPFFLMGIHYSFFIEGQSLHYIYPISVFYLSSFIVAALIYTIQNRKLRFNKVAVKISQKRSRAILNEVAQENKWLVLISSEDQFIAQSSRNTIVGEAGELITIIYNNNELLINSINDPTKIKQLFNEDRNKLNVDLIIKRIAKVNDEFVVEKDFYNSMFFESN